MSLIESVEYPGRGLAIGRDADGVPFFTYWLTGRSPASQARELVVHDREIIVRDTSGGPVDDLRHYTAATRGDDWVIVGNGTQVGELTAAREQQPDLQLALRQLTYEPDPPIRTPRITAAATITGTELTDVVIGSARAYDGAPELTEHPSLYAARLVRDPAGGWCLLGFRDWEHGVFHGEIVDPIPVAWTGRGLVERPV